MTKDEMKQRTKQFSLRVLRLCRSLPQTVEAQAVRKQLVRCGTSVGANYRAALRARSSAEFRSKLGIVEEEADESLFWLETVIEEQMLQPDLVAQLLDEANQITSIIVATICSSKQNANR